MSQIRFSAADIAEGLGQLWPTDEQCAVIEAPLDHRLVVAGAGSGKTETMSARVVWLVANGLASPDRVLGLTFTRKAAMELGARIGRRLDTLAERGLWVPPDALSSGSPVVSTYDSYAGRVVSEHGMRLGREPETSLITAAAEWQIAADTVESYDGPMDYAGAVSTEIGAVMELSAQMSGHLVTPGELRSYLEEFDQHLSGLALSPRQRGLSAEVTKMQTAVRKRLQLLPVIEAFRQAKRDREVISFSEQMELAARLAQQVPAVGAVERSRYDVVLLDEFQDTSSAQLQFLSCLFAAEGAPPVIAVGDPHQSIYGWRGASATTLAGFVQAFSTPERTVPVLPLSTTWRNETSVLEVANVIAGPLRESAAVSVVALAPRPDAGPGLVHAARVLTVEDEAELVADWIVEHRDVLARPGHAPSAAVLCRKRRQFGPMVSALRARGLPVDVVGLGGLLETTEVADLIALLEVVADPAANPATMRLVTGPACRLGAADLYVLERWSRELASRYLPGEKRPDDADAVVLAEVIEELPPGDFAPPGAARPLSAPARARLTELAGVISSLRARSGRSLVELVSAAIRELGLDVELLAHPEVDEATALAQLDAFTEHVAAYESSAAQPSLTGLLSWLEAARSQERGLSSAAESAEVREGFVQVLTVHAAKGLEWDLVATPGLGESDFPEFATPKSPPPPGSWHQPSDKGWLQNASSLPVALRGDRDGLPRWDIRQVDDSEGMREAFSDFAAALGEHGLREERRLAYVAVTRARRALLLSSSIWDTRSTPTPVSRFLAELLEHPQVEVLTWCDDPQPDESGKFVNPRLSSVALATWPTEAPADAAAVEELRADLADALADGAGQEAAPGEPGSVVLGDQAPDAQLWDIDASITVLLAERAARGSVTPWELPQHMSTSDLVAMSGDPQRFLADVRRPIPRAPSPAARRGTHFHEWVEQHYHRAALWDLDDLELSTLDADDVDEAELDAMKDAFLASEWADRVPHYLELPLETPVGGFTIRGRLDAVFARDDGGWTVVDWKSGRQPRGDHARQRTWQLAAYRIAFARWAGVPVELVDGAFYYAGSGLTVRPDLPGEEDMLALLAGLAAEPQLGRDGALSVEPSASPAWGSSDPAAGLASSDSAPRPASSDLGTGASSASRDDPR